MGRNKKSIIKPILAAQENIENIWALIKGYVLKTWNDIKSGISSIAKGIYNHLIKPFVDGKNFISDILSDAFNWGKNLIQNIINGINSMIDKAKSAVSNVASTISNFLGFHSPAKEGPGSDADKWAPNLMQMFSEGIYSNIGNIQAAVNATAGALQGLNVQPKVGFAAARSYGGNVIGQSSEIHLYIGTLIADDYGLKN
ncbi:phage tail protein [Caloramator sp. Dgby_cultured_2]|uniref:phage tail protein n=1 Tax=Caloramator sp. Dgby_cultured_2 TaxID=3029174 RepID=UPI00237DD9B7|nr:hypothetical protein [Caloramator sp. Dgby_cultured_2]WDU82268.1 hypothetical protein PWK10_11215 [Caloramator sp. Dgby_cultured_2]